MDNFFSKLTRNPIFLILLGVVLGIFAKIGDSAISGTFLYYFGLVTSGMVIWLDLCSIIICGAKSKFRAVGSILLFMVPMLISYYTYSKFVAKYFAPKFVIFWALFLVASSILGFFIFTLRQKKLFRILFVIGSVICIIYDIIVINSGDILLMAIDLLLTVVTFVYVKSVTKRRKKS